MSAKDISRPISGPGSAVDCYRVRLVKDRAIETWSDEQFELQKKD